MDLPEGRQVGIMADDLEKTFPQLIKNNEFDLNDDPENQDSNKKENLLKFKAVNYIGLVPVLVKAIQEQQQTIEKQTQMIEEMKQDYHDQINDLNEKVDKLLTN